MDQNAGLILKFDTGAATHVGKVRKANEDSFIVKPSVGLWAVADGVGGHEAGQIASQTLTQTLATLGRPVSLADQLARFQERVIRANDQIRDIAESRGGGTMGTTVAALLIFDDAFSCAWAGDSRVYRIRDRTVQQVSKDHSEVQELVDQGVITPEEAKNWPRRNVITRAVGVYDDPQVETVEGRIEVGDTFVICSDGLTGHMSDADIGAAVIGARPQDACDRLIETTLERGASDNVSIIVVRCYKTERTNFVPGSSFGDGKAQS